QFGHIFSGDHYASGYYSYMWSEVMDADAFGAFEEAGDIFDPATAKRLHDDIYSSGGSRDPENAYVAFRGREPEADALLRRRGLLGTPEAACGGMADAQDPRSAPPRCRHRASPGRVRSASPRLARCAHRARGRDRRRDSRHAP